MSKKDEKKEECKNEQKTSLWQQYCPNCPPWQRVALYSIPILLALPYIVRKLLCPPKCAKINKCFKPPPGCCKPVVHYCKKPRDCYDRKTKTNLKKC